MKNYFELNELLHSSTALENKFENLPTWEVVEHLKELRDEILNPLREAWGSAINVTSGYRCKKLNDMLANASKTSVHMIGYACDIVPANGKIDEFIEFCKEWFKDKIFDQVIIEYSGKSRWVHIGLKSNSGLQRRLLFKIVI